MAVARAADPTAGHKPHAASAVQFGTPAESGIAGCTALLDTRRVAARELPKIRCQFARSRWPDLRAAGTNYVDLIVKLRHARGTNGYEAVWFYERLAGACVRHDAEITVYG